MKKSKTLAIEYSGLSDLGLAATEHLDGTIREFLTKDGLVLCNTSNVLDNYMGSPSRSSNIIAGFGNAVIEYDSRKTTNKEETEVYSHFINLYILSENPEQVASYIRHNLFGALAFSKTYKEEEYDELLTPFMLGTEQLFLSAYSKEELAKVHDLLTSGRSILYDKAD